MDKNIKIKYYYDETKGKVALIEVGGLKSGKDLIYMI